VAVIAPQLPCQKHLRHAHKATLKASNSNAGGRPGPGLSCSPELRLAGDAPPHLCCVGAGGRRRKLRQESLRQKDRGIAGNGRFALESVGASRPPKG
jgi:hypothetical protein